MNKKDSSNSNGKSQTKELSVNKSECQAQGQKDYTYKISWLMKPFINFLSFDWWTPRLENQA